MPEYGLRLRITCDGPSMQDARVFLDDIDISRGVNSLVLVMEHTRINKLHLTITPSTVEIDARTYAILKAHVVEQSGGDL